MNRLSIGNSRFLLPVCRFCWFLYTFKILLYMHIFCHIFLSNYWWQEWGFWSQTSYRYAILWEAFLDLSDSYFLFADLVGFYTHWTYMHIFRHIFLSNYWWQRSDIWSCYETELYHFAKSLISHFIFISDVNGSFTFYMRNMYNCFVRLSTF